MPIYEYEREDGTVFEQIQKASDDPLEKCPTTGQRVRRLMSASAFHLKGSGWYKTDYAGSSNGASSNGSSAKSSSSAGDSSGSESKKDSSSSSSSESSPKKGCGSGCGCH